MPGVRIATAFAALLIASVSFDAVAAPLFGAPFLSFDTSNGPTSLALGDLNGDGKPDVVVGNQGSNVVSIMLGDGNGNLVVQGVLVSGIAPRAVAIDDLNADGKPDLVATNGGNSPAPSRSVT
jgi:hypothetical protein